MLLKLGLHDPKDVYESSKSLWRDRNKFNKFVRPGLGRGVRERGRVSGGGRLVGIGSKSGGTVEGLHSPPCLVEEACASFEASRAIGLRIEEKSGRLTERCASKAVEA